MPNSKERWILLSQKLGWAVQRFHPTAGCAELRDDRGCSILLTHQQRDDILGAIEADSGANAGKQAARSRG